MDLSAWMSVDAGLERKGEKLRAIKGSNHSMDCTDPEHVNTSHVGRSVTITLINGRTESGESITLGAYIVSIESSNWREPIVNRGSISMVSFPWKGICGFTMAWSSPLEQRQGKVRTGAGHLWTLLIQMGLESILNLIWIKVRKRRCHLSIASRKSIKLKFHSIWNFSPDLESVVVLLR